MALIKCPYCGNMFSEFADGCPQCGYPIEVVLNARRKEVNNVNSKPAHQENIYAAPRSTSSKQKNNKWLIGIITVLVVFAIGIAGMVIYLSGDNQKDEHIVREEVINREEDHLTMETDESVNDDHYNSYDSYDNYDDGYDERLSTTKLTESDLAYLSKHDLEILRNMIYARHGYRFKRDDLFNYFLQFSWYNPSTSDANVAAREMSSIELYNIDFIKQHE